MNGHRSTLSGISLSAWRIQSSAELRSDGAAIASADFDDRSWYSARVPTTVLAALVAAGEYPEPHFGTRLQEIPRERFRRPWWYRTQFELPALEPAETVLLQLDGVNYAGNVWLNGRQLMNSTDLRGAYRRFQLDVSTRVNEGMNVLAIEVLGPQPGDFSTGFVDWNPPPPDGNMGLFRPVTLRRCRSVSIDNPFVHTHVETGSFEQAELTITAELVNHADYPVQATLRVCVESLSLQQEVKLAAGERQEVKFSPSQYRSLVLQQPRLWWPHDLGAAELYRLELECRVGSVLSDQRHVTFGIRQVDDYSNSQGHRGYRINGRDVLIKAGGWTDDLLLADSPESLEAQIRYVKHLHLNTIRLEGIWGTDQTLYDLCDRHGILMMVGWSCHWEHEEYLGRPVDERFGGVSSAGDIDLISRCWTDQVLWLRHHPSIFVWTVASDKVPHPDLERNYVETFRRYDPDRPYLASTGGVGSEQAIIGKEVIVSDVSGPTGVKMLGPYQYTPPVYWYEDHRRGGAYGLNTETCPGAVVPVWESLQRMIPRDHLWPIDDVWNFHCGLNAFSTLDCFCEALRRRYGDVDTPERFAYVAQVLNYELARPMFEAFRVHKGRATGVVQWMLNAAWPKLYWQLYDWFLQPTGAFYATRQACTPLQLVYDYARHSVFLVNDTLETLENLAAAIQLVDLTGRTLYHERISCGALPQSSRQIGSLPALPDDSPVSFLRLGLSQGEAEIASNVYWLSTTPDLLDYEAKVQPWEYYTPSRQYADYRALSRLPSTTVDLQITAQPPHDRDRLTVTLTNSGSSIALCVEVLALDAGTERPIIPILWSDNFVTLLPQERKTLSAELRDAPAEIELRLRGWNLRSGATA